MVVLGGYGNFGKRIMQALAEEPSIELICAGRSQEKAEDLISALQTIARARLRSAVLDIHSAEFPAALSALNPFLVIHTGGPYQGQNYCVAESCINIGAHYVDLADDRRFVCDISALNHLAQKAGVQIISGASSVPGLSSVVIAALRAQFQHLDCVDIAIAPGNKAERGEATLRGILSYTGHSFPVFENGAITKVYGWMNPRRKWLGNRVGSRWLANVDVPDLELFPGHFNVRCRVRFQASLELPFLHFSMVFMAALARIRLIPDWSRFTSAIYAMSHWFERFGSGDGAMQIDMSGTDHNGKHLHRYWRLEAFDGIGPYIPTLSALIIARQLLSGKIAAGARPCIDAFSLEEFVPYARNLNLQIEEGGND